MGKLSGGGQPGPGTGFVELASCSSVRSSTYRRTVAIRSARKASTLIERWPGVAVARYPGGIGHLIPRQVEGVPRRRVTEDAPADPGVSREHKMSERLDELPLALDPLVQQLRVELSGPVDGPGPEPLDYVICFAGIRPRPSVATAPGAAGRVRPRSAGRRQRR